MERTADYSDDLVRNCVDDGNKLLMQQDTSRAINKYDQAIKHRPYYAIAHYNKRIALSMQNDIPSNSVEHKEMNTNQLINTVKDLNLASSADTCFVINTIAAVTKHTFSDDSSEEESDEEFNSLYEKLVNNNDCPFTTSKQTRHKTTKLKTESKIIEQKSSCVNQSTDSIVVDSFLSKLSENGFEIYERDKLSKIAVSIGLNRMYSISTRKNNSLILELESKVNTRKIKYKFFGYYWTCSWYTKDGKEANIEYVRSFYKKLKRKNPDLAKKFIAQEEKEGAERNVPYQNIREYAKNHPKTKELIKEFRDNNSNAMIYLHLADDDVSHFNGIYSAYLRIIDGCYKPPTVMSTGYEFPKDTQYMAYHLLSSMERMHRVITTFYIPLGTYYPEPNMCILIPQNCENVEESFIDRRRGQGRTLESAILLKNIQNNRQNVYAIFSEDNPIITNIPSRAKVYKQTQQSIPFSLAFNTGLANPTSKDIKKYSQVSQSHSNILTWSNSLFINSSIKYDNNYETDGECINNKNNKPLKGVDKQCKTLIANIRNNNDVELSQYKLGNRIGDANANDIVNAVKTINQYNTDFNTKYERTPEEQELIDIMNEREIPFTDLSRKSLLLIINSQIIDLIKDNTIDLQDLIDLDEETLEFILNRDEIIQALKDKTVYLDDLIDLRDNLDEFSEALNEYSVEYIVKSYKEDPLHLKFMADGPWDIVYMNSDDENIVRFAIEHQYIDDEDVATISEELLRGKDESAANMDFNAILLRIEHEGELEEYSSYEIDEEEYNNEYSDVESMGQVDHS
ncbi:uncharacterized protein LOC143375973 [Andrena cerasifolii]|uniref:uncharacterized protein LOC143375973 n=1 Tax=Andrena cerasifolii TaxID=2819439 RepID=UPI0040382C04